MVDALKKAGIRNYSIFRHGLTLFGYFETDDLDATIAALKDDPVNARWSESMAPIMKIEIDEPTRLPLPAAAAMAHGLRLAHARPSISFVTPRLDRGVQGSRATPAQSCHPGSRGRAAGRQSG